MATATTRKKAVRIDPSELVEVMNGSAGQLIYAVKGSDGSTISSQKWSSYGEVQLLTVQELMRIRGQQERMFRDQWMVVLDAEVINYLKLDQYYKNLMTPEELDTFFDKTTEEISKYIKTASNGAKMLIAGRARKMYESGTLTDINKIRTVNDALGIHIADLD